MQLQVVVVVLFSWQMSDPPLFVQEPPAGAEQETEGAKTQAIAQGPEIVGSSIPASSFSGGSKLLFSAEDA